MSAERPAMAILRDEHRIILRGLEVLEAAARRVGAGGSLPDGWWDELIEWLVAFADRSHHAKEELGLFPALITAGLPSGAGPVAMMLEEHVAGRDLVRAMRAGDAAERARAGALYVDLLRGHIDKENGVLFPLADVLLDDRTATALEGRFASLASTEDSHLSRDEAEARIDRLVAALG
jgi:hemerythrin-like domain-containing protein